MAKTYIKDRKDFMKHYDKPPLINELKERVFYREISEDKVEVKIALPCYQKEIKQLLETIKD